MRRVTNGFMAMAIGCALGFATIACDDTARGIKKDTAEATDKARDATNAAKAEAKDEAAEARAEGREAANDARKAAGSAGAAIDAAAETIDVKAALIAEDAVDASDINVDTFHETKTVVLKGSVPSAAQKVTAGQIAALEANGYKINNQLVVKSKK